MMERLVLSQLYCQPLIGKHLGRLETLGTNECRNWDPSRPSVDWS